VCPQWQTYLLLLPEESGGVVERGYQSMFMSDTDGLEELIIMYLIGMLTATSLFGTWSLGSASGHSDNAGSFCG